MSNDIKASMRGYYSVYFKVNAIYEQFAKMYGLTSSSLYVLYIIHEHPEQCTQSLIAEELFYPKQTVSSILDSFERQGYITKIISSQDKRNKNIILTEAGREFSEPVIADMFRLEETAFSRMNDKERQEMLHGERAFLEQLTKSLDAFGQTHTGPGNTQ